MQNETDNFIEEGNLGLVGRRRFLGWVTAATCGVVFSVREAKAGLFYSTRPVAGIPQSWVDKKGLDVLRYANYIKGLRLKNITPYHVLYPHFKTRGRTTNSIPPRYMWRNIAGSLRVLDGMAYHMRAKIKPLVSVYRSPNYNRAVRGRSQSQHLSNRAIDVQFYGVSAYTVTKVARKFRSAGHFKGGVGSYSSFTHIDTRGHNADW